MNQKILKNKTLEASLSLAKTGDKDHQALWKFGLKNPTALAMLHFFSAHAVDEKRGVVMSAQALAQTMGIASRTAQVAIKALSDARLILLLKSGKSNVYVLNPNVAWIGSKGQRHAVLTVEIVVTEEEQIEAVDNLIEQAKLLNKVSNF